MAYQLIQQDFLVPPKSRLFYKKMKAAMYWAPYTIKRHLKMMNLSQALNQTTDVKMKAN
jgi:hypothetical protein